MIEWLVRIVMLVVLLLADGTMMGPTSVRDLFEHRDRSLPESVPTEVQVGPSAPLAHRCVARGQHREVRHTLSSSIVELTVADPKTTSRLAPSATRPATAPRSAENATPAPREHRCCVARPGPGLVARWLS